MPVRFAFIVPLRNPSVAKDWTSTVRLCVETLRSLSRPANSDHKVFLVCRDFPEVEFGLIVRIIRHPFPDPEKNWKAQHKDKYAKIKMGLVELRKVNDPHYVMKFDADDLISDKVVPWVLAQGNGRGYFVDQGYRLQESRGLLAQVKTGLHKTCGSTNILYALPTDMPRSMEDDGNFDLMTQGHNIVTETFLARGTPLEPIPFPAVISRLGTGENITSHYSPNTDHPPARPNWKFYVGRYIAEFREAVRRATAKEVSHELAAEFLLPGRTKLVS
jgi:hypothetical protein